MFDDVFEFRKAFGLSTSDKVRLLPEENQMLHARLLQEELYEFTEAKTIAQQADALLDMMYLIVGALEDMGIYQTAASVCWKYIHDANMSKIKDGIVLKRADGKVIKPDGWIAPDMSIAHELGTIMYEQAKSEEEGE
jgi:predicted HAD superfamily Cof-like phosphohydrolase